MIYAFWKVAKTCRRTSERIHKYPFLWPRIALHPAAAGSLWRGSEGAAQAGQADQGPLDSPGRPSKVENIWICSPGLQSQIKCNDFRPAFIYTYFRMLWPVLWIINILLADHDPLGSETFYL
jgi:hypothetical protein